MEIIHSLNNIPILITPLMHHEVVKPRPPDYIYPAVRMRIESDRAAISAFLEKIRPFAYHDNLNKLGNFPASAEEPYWGNGWFDAGDARAVYGVVGMCEPRRIIEIGSGNSTKFMRRSILDFGLKTHLTSIDPAPRAEIDSICDTIIRRSVLDVDLDLFLSLESGDILFHDGSHLTFNGTDTVRLFLEILPKVASGVLIHIHDICLPREYVKSYDGRGYSEQYMLAAALMFSDQLEVVLPVAYLGSEGSFDFGVSFWMRKK